MVYIMKKSLRENKSEKEQSVAKIFKREITETRNSVREIINNARMGSARIPHVSKSA